MPLTSKDIVPISHARTHLAELADEVVRNHSAKMLTRNGESLVALISAADFDELQRWRQAEHLQDLRRIVEAVREHEAGQSMDLEDFRAEVRALADWIDAPDAATPRRVRSAVSLTSGASPRPAKKTSPRR